MPRPQSVGGYRNAVHPSEMWFPNDNSKSFEKILMGVGTNVRDTSRQNSIGLEVKRSKVKVTVELSTWVGNLVYACLN